jgi:ferritin
LVQEYLKDFLDEKGTESKNYQNLFGKLKLIGKNFKRIIKNK